MISEFGNYPIEYFQDWRFIVGLIMFIVGYNINRRSDAILQKIRSNKPETIANDLRNIARTDNIRNRKNKFLNISEGGYVTHEGSEGDDEFESDASTTLSSIHGKANSDSEHLTENHIKEDILARNETYVDKSGVLYKIPFGGFYDYVSSANYFGEIIEWLGWTLATYSLAGLSFAML
jgi:hypothetical protein